MSRATTGETLIAPHHASHLLDLVNRSAMQKKSGCKTLIHHHGETEKHVAQLLDSYYKHRSSAWLQDNLKLLTESSSEDEFRFSCPSSKVGKCMLRVFYHIKTHISRRYVISCTASTSGNMSFCLSFNLETWITCFQKYICSALSFRVLEYGVRRWRVYFFIMKPCR